MQRTNKYIGLNHETIKLEPVQLLHNYIATYIPIIYLSKDYTNTLKPKKYLKLLYIAKL